MSAHVIAWAPRTLAALLPTPPSPTAALTPSLDQWQRPLRDLRISVTDRCNFRCSYCMPKDIFGANHAYLPHSQVLSFEEIVRTAHVFAQRGVQKIRLTGGEPLLRKHIEVLVAQLAQLRTPQGQPLALTLTTNGSLLARKAQALKDAGLQRVTVSLDALDDAVFRRMNDVDFPVRDVLHGIDAALAAGLGPVKVNMVVKRGTNDDQIVPMAAHFRGTGVQLRFIEYMDVGATNGWQMNEVLPSAQVLARLQAHWPLVALPGQSVGETAQRFGHTNAQGLHDPALGEVGTISSVTQAFCGDCNRARLSTDGRLFLCLFASQGHDLRQWLRQPEVSDADLAAAIDAIWQGRVDRYSQLRGTPDAASTASTAHADTPHASAGSAPDAPRRVEMSYIGG